MRGTSHYLGVVLAPTVVQASHEGFHLRAVLDWSSSD